MNVELPRYAPERSFPPYAFLPGRDPHPERDPKGHSYGHERPEAEYFPSQSWRQNGDYLWGVDLYNHGYLWEAHEAWEGLWHRAKHDHLQAEHLQGLIQCAAASLKIPMGQARGLALLGQQGTRRLELVSKEGAPEYMGIDLPSFVAAFRRFVDSQPESADQRPRLELELELE